MKYHVAIILDGNRRYAKKLGIAQMQGHLRGVENVEALLDWCIESGKVRELTLYVFSMENFRRSVQEKAYLSDLFVKEFTKLRSRPSKDIRFRIIGRRELFSEKVQEAMKSMEKDTKDNKGLLCNLAMAYGGRTEIVDAVQKIVKNPPETIDEDVFRSYLYIEDEPDILIRTGGDKRISNFLIWQSAYTELFFVDKYWPEFLKEDLFSIIREFEGRQRRWGG